MCSRARSPGDCVAFYPLDARMAFEYYVARAPRRRRRAALGACRSIPWTPSKPYAEQYVTLSRRRRSRRSAVAARGCGSSQRTRASAHGPSAESRVNWAQFVALRAALERAYKHHARTQFSYAATIHVDLLTRR